MTIWDAKLLNINLPPPRLVFFNTNLTFISHFTHLPRLHAAAATPTDAVFLGGSLVVAAAALTLKEDIAEYKKSFHQVNFCYFFYYAHGENAWRIILFLLKKQEKV